MYLVRIFKLYCLSAFQLHNTMLSTTVTMFYIRSSGHSQLVTKSFYPLNNLFLFPPTPACWQPPCYSVPMNLTFFFNFHRINTTQYLSFSIWIISGDWWVWGWEGGPRGRENTYICIYISDHLRCTTETSKILLSSCTPTYGELFKNTKNSDWLWVVYFYWVSSLLSTFLNFTGLL